jgi:IS30 family transposase
LHNRPAEAADRQQAGHWEGDLMAFAIYGHNLLAAQERTSRLIALARQPSKHADPVTSTLRRWLKDLPPRLRRAFDNGAEFATHHQLRRFGLMTFFCKPHASWQKGAVENAIGRLRRYLPRKTNLDKVSPTQLLACATTTTQDSVWTSRPQPRSSHSCCTWNVTPRPRLRGDERK